MTILPSLVAIQYVVFDLTSENTFSAPISSYFSNYVVVRVVKQAFIQFIVTLLLIKVSIDIQDLFSDKFQVNKYVKYLS